VEPEPRWQLRLHHGQEAHRHDLSCSLSGFFSQVSLKL
jgi:hypothetical protein